MNKKRLLGVCAAVLFPVFGPVFVAMAADAELPRVMLKGKEIKIESEEAILVRTSETAAKMKVVMKLPFGHTYCAEYETRMVYGQDPSCGYSTECREECYSRCEVRLNGHCESWGRDECGTVCSEVMDSCMHPESVCVRHAVAYQNEEKSFKLVFKNATKLGAGEEELFKVSGRQSHVDSWNDLYSFEVVDAKSQYKVKKFNFFGDWIKVKGEK